MKYRFNNHNKALKSYDGQEVTYLGKVFMHDVPGISADDQLHKIRFADGQEGVVFGDELINPAEV